jgi:ribosome-associated translation inhibitor RaiA
MDIPIQVNFRGIKRTASLLAAVRAHAAQLDHFHPHLISCRAMIGLAGRHKHKGKQFVVRLGIKVAGGEIAVNRDHAEDPRAAIRDAFEAAVRQLQDHARRMRGDVKSHQSAAPA